jgi:hypothetical protein
MLATGVPREKVDLHSLVICRKFLFETKIQNFRKIAEKNLNIFKNNIFTHSTFINMVYLNFVNQIN